MDRRKVSSLGASNQPAFLAPMLQGRVVKGAAAARLNIDGQDYVNFFGSGYLALSNLPEIRQAVQDQLDCAVPFGRQIPSILAASETVFDEVEKVGSLALGADASLYLASGYLVGMAGVASLEGSFDLCILDEHAHFNLRDAARLSGRRFVTFRHCDVASLETILRKSVKAGQRPLLMTDGVFATSGRVPPLKQYQLALEPYEGRLFVDESHGFGVVGKKGRGAVEYCGVKKSVSVGATLGKAFCAQGALIGCDASALGTLKKAPVIRGANSGSPLSAAAATTSIAYVAAHPELTDKLRTLATYFRSRLRNMGVATEDSPAPIISFAIGRRRDMLELQRRAFTEGIHIYHSNYIGAGSEGVIRCAVFADHRTRDIDALIDLIGRL